jgi:hypothetical protein
MNPQEARLCRLASTKRRISSPPSTHNRILFSTLIALSLVKTSAAQAIHVAGRQLGQGLDDSGLLLFKRAVNASTTTPPARQTTANNNNGGGGGGGQPNVMRIVVIAIVVTVLGEFFQCWSLAQV